MQQLVKIRPEDNQQRYYVVSVLPGLFGNWAVQREYGRLGQRGGQLRRDWYDSEEIARQEAETLVKSKEKRGYQLAEAERCHASENAS